MTKGRPWRTHEDGAQCHRRQRDDVQSPLRCRRPCRSCTGSTPQSHQGVTATSSWRHARSCDECGASQKRRCICAAVQAVATHRMPGSHGWRREWPAVRGAGTAGRSWQSTRATRRIVGTRPPAVARRSCRRWSPSCSSRCDRPQRLLPKTSTFLADCPNCPTGVQNTHLYIVVRQARGN